MNIRFSGSEAAPVVGGLMMILRVEAVFIVNENVIFHISHILNYSRSVTVLKHKHSIKAGISYEFLWWY